MDRVSVSKTHFFSRTRALRPAGCSFVAVDREIAMLHALEITPEARREGVALNMLGRAAILHHDFPGKYAQDPGFVPASLPVSREYLGTEGLSPVFVDYMAGWPGFVAD